MSLNSRLPSSVNPGTFPGSGTYQIPSVVSPSGRMTGNSTPMINQTPREMGQINSLPTNGYPSQGKSSAYDNMLASLGQALEPLTQAWSANSYQYPNNFNVNWRKESSIRKLYQIATALGRAPDTLDPTPGGMASWRDPAAKTGGNYLGFAVFDPRIPFIKPNLHGAHMKVALVMPLTQHTQWKLHKFSDCIHYNSEMGVVSVHGHFLGHAILELAILKMMNEGRINHHDACRYHYMWKPLIMDEWRDVMQMENMYMANTPITDILERYVLSS